MYIVLHSNLAKRISRLCLRELMLRTQCTVYTEYGNNTGTTLLLLLLSFSELAKLKSKTHSYAEQTNWKWKACLGNETQKRTSARQRNIKKNTQHQICRDILPSLWSKSSSNRILSNRICFLMPCLESLKCFKTIKIPFQHIAAKRIQTHT